MISKMVSAVVHAGRVLLGFVTAAIAGFFRLLFSGIRHFFTLKGFFFTSMIFLEMNVMLLLLKYICDINHLLIH